MPIKRFAWSMIVLLSFLLAVSVMAGSLEAPGKPSEASCAMFTLEDIYSRLNTGTLGSKRTGGVVMPTSGPAVIGKNTNEIMAVAPTFNRKRAKQEDMACGKTFWGLAVGVWGPQTGTAGCPPPTNIQVTGAQNGQAVISWTAVSGATAYNLYGATQSGVNKYNHTSLLGSILKQNITSPYTLTGLTNGTTYYLVVSAVSSGGEGLAAAVTTTPVYERFIANGNGTVTDSETGLILLQNANCSGNKTWDNAMDWVANLNGDGTSCGLNDKSMPGDWRLPTYTSQSGILDGELAVLYAAKNSTAFSGVQTNSYWSGTTVASTTGYAWYVTLYFGNVYIVDKTFTYYVWPVRGGQ
ncbi:MAG: DUF1566 domain-containing protein [Magnetococcales bacterium]|nr:DUF1566 domain-containing protein [Magnetococcales bacterium]